MKLSRLLLVVCAAILGAIVVIAGGAVIGQGGGLPTWLNYQGRLTQPNGAAIADGSYSATFRIFDSPLNGTQLWSATIQIAVKGGVFSTALGKSPQAAFPADLFTRRLWLESEVESRVLMPRQELGAVAFAMRAMSVPESALPSGAVVPIGSVIAWFGDSDAVPSGWKLCDGSSISDPQSPLNGMASPNLVGRFIRGATGNVRPTPPTGGSDTQTLSVAQMPSHSHGVNDPGHTHIYLGSSGTLQGGSTRYAGGNGGTSYAEIQTANTGISIQNSGGGQPFGIVPAYVGLVYIMRVR